MKLLLTILACLVAASAGAQTIKSLGYNTTNGNIVAATNVTFTNSVGFATNARAATRTNLGGTTVGNAVFTATNAAAAASAIGLGTNNYPKFLGLELGGGDETQINGTSISFIEFGGQFNFEERKLSQADATVFSWATNSFTVTPSATFATNVTVGGTLAVTGNVALSGVNNTATAQTADSASSLMTRDLSDDRYRLFYVPLVHAQSSTAANGSTWNLRPFHSSDAVFSAPPWARNVRVYLSTAFTNAPITNNFTAVITAYSLTTNNISSSWGTITNTFSVTPVFNNGSNSYRFILRMTNDLALPSGGISDAESASFWNILIQLRNDSSGSLTTVADNWLRGMAVFSD